MLDKNSLVCFCGKNQENTDFIKLSVRIATKLINLEHISAKQKKGEMREVKLLSKELLNKYVLLTVDNYLSSKEGSK